MYFWAGLKRCSRKINQARKQTKKSLPDFLVNIKDGEKY